jgi:hypothetical protein
MNKHTPGPWKYARAVQNNGPDYFAITDGKWGSPSIVNVFADNEANARLIAKAPEMYAILDKISRGAIEYHDWQAVRELIDRIND